jgi:hypothetical protein
MSESVGLHVELHVELQEGFDDDRVEVAIDGSRFEFPSLRTRYQIGLAEVIDVEVPAGAVDVRVVLPDRSLEGRSGYTVYHEVWVAVNVASGSVDFTWSEEPFFYA